MNIHEIKNKIYEYIINIDQFNINDKKIINEQLDDLFADTTSFYKMITNNNEITTNLTRYIICTNIIKFHELIHANIITLSSTYAISLEYLKLLDDKYKEYVNERSGCVYIFKSNKKFYVLTFREFLSIIDEE